MSECSSDFRVCFSASGCSDGSQNTGRCWIGIICYIVIAIILFLSTFIMDKLKGKEPVLEFNPKRHTLMQTSRSESNFTKTNIDSEINFPVIDSRAHYVNLFSKGTATEFLKSLWQMCVYDRNAQTKIITYVAVSLLSMSLSSVFAMLHRHEKFKEDCMEDLDLEYSSFKKEYFLSVIKTISSFIDSFKFLPIFLLLAYISFLVDRWRTFMVSCHNIQGSLCDIGVLVGSIPEGPVSDEAKKQVYKIYKLLNVVHILCYKNFMRDEFKNDEKMAQLVKMNLLTAKEGVYFSSMSNKVREGMCATLVCEIDGLLRLCENKNNGSTAVILKKKVCDFRGNMATLHNTFICDNPNEFIFTMKYLVIVYEWAIVFGYPFVMYVDTTNNSCRQPMTFIATYFTLFALKIPFSLFEKLKDPFDGKNDINTEALIASVESALFQSMRCQFSA